MRLTPKRAARSCSVPRKSPGLSFLANSASRTSATISEDSEAERPATKIGAALSVRVLRIAGCTDIGGPAGLIVKILSYGLRRQSAPSGFRREPEFVDN